MIEGNVLGMSTRTAPGPGFSQPDEIASALTTFINTTIMARDRPVGPDEDLEEAGVDSMALLKILLFIEAEFGFWIPDEDLVEANTASARALANYICQRGKPS
jgi:acyl carrier protein